MVVLVVLALIGATTLVIASASLLWPSRVARETANRIHPGMSRAEVEAILGPKAELIYRPLVPSQKPQQVVQDAGSRQAIACVPVYRWGDDSGAIWITFDDARRVDDVYYYPPRQIVDPSFLESLCSWVKSKWQRWFP
jgi:hypothetical protein